MPDDVGYRDGWLNRHAPANGLFSSRESSQNWRLVRASVNDGVLALWTAQHVPYRTFDVNAPLHAGNIGVVAASASASGGSLSGTTFADSNSSPRMGPYIPPQGGVSAPPSASMASLSLEAAPTHLDTSLHPELLIDENGVVTGGSTQALAHYLLFSPMDPIYVAEVAIALPFYTDFLTLIGTVKSYIDHTASRTMRNADPVYLTARVAVFVNGIVTSYPGVLVNTNVLAGLQQIAESLARIDDNTSRALKLDVYNRFEAASQSTLKNVSVVQTGSAPAIEEILAAKIQQGIRSYSTQLWLPPDLFFDRDFIGNFADQISLFHQRYWASWAPTGDMSLLFHRGDDSSFSEWRENPLVFDLETPHFLGSLLLNHAFAPQLDNAERGRVFSNWIMLGSALREMGDIVGWVAIASVMCQVPILRLRESWAYVDTDLRSRVSHEWGFEVFELEKRAAIDILDKTTFRASTEDMGEKYPKERCVPYFGDIIVVNQNVRSLAGSTSLPHVVEQIHRMKAVIDGWYYYYEQSPDVESPEPLPEMLPSFQGLLSGWLKLNASLPNPLRTAAATSLAVQPKSLGNYLPFYYTQRLPLTSGAFVPILFTEVNPSFRLLPKAALMSTSAIAAMPVPSAKRSLRTLNFSNSNGSPQISSPTPQQRGLRRSNSFPPLNQPLATGVREVELGTREYVTKHSSGHALVRTIRDLFNVGVTTHLVGSDIVLKSIDDEVSRGSRTSSIIENLGRRSVLLDSRRQSVQSLELAGRMSSIDAHHALSVMVKAASLKRLVDILVLGVGEFSAQGSGLRFKINLPVHTETFLATFRSFCSPAELLRMLEHRFDGAAGAAISIVQHRNGQFSVGIDDNFPKWSITNDAPSAQASRVVTQIHCNILEALQFWVAEYYFDFADDDSLRTSTHAFLKRIESVLSLSNVPENVQSQAKRLLGSFVKQRYKVADVPRAVPRIPVARHMVHILPQPGDGSLHTLEDQIDELDAIVADNFNIITMRDWMQLFEVLELQVSNCNDLFNYAVSGSSEDDLEIQDIFSYFSTLYRTTPDDKTTANLPPSIGKLFKLHMNISDYIAYQVSDPMIYVVNRSRVSRMTYVLKLLGILKTRMRYFDLFPEVGDKGTRVPSFLESAIVAGILRPESRAYAQAWLQAGRDIAGEFGYDFESTMESFKSLGLQTFDIDAGAPPNSQTLFIPNIPAELLSSDGDGIRPITPCIGWVTERLFEIVSYVPNMSVDNSELINFDKHRYAYNLVKNIQSEFVFKPSASLDMDKLYAQYDYLVNPDPSMYKIDRRGVKEALARETQGMSKSQLKQRAFSAAVLAEQEKLRLEARQLENLSSKQPPNVAIPASSSTSSLALRERRSSRTNRPVSTVFSSPPGSSGQSNGSDKDRKSQRSRFGAGLLKAVRPLSMAFSSSAPQATPAGNVSSVHPSNLPILTPLEEGSYKHIATLDLSEYDIKGPFSGGIFRLVKVNSSQGQDQSFQATSDQDANAWIHALLSARKRAVARVQAQPGSTRVFGVPLEVVCAREHVSVPIVLDTLLEQIEERGLDEVGLYRISGSLAAINTLKAAFDNGEVIRGMDPRWQDINAVAGCVKLYLRELPEPLLTNELFGEFVACSNLNPELQLDGLRRTIERLPVPNYAALKRLMTHLNMVVEHEALNKMSTPNLAIVFSMNFLPHNAMDQMRAMQSIVNTMIVHQRALFEVVGSPPPSASTGAHQTPNNDSPASGNYKGTSL